MQLMQTASYLIRCYKCAVNKTTHLQTSFNQRAVSQVHDIHFEQVGVLVDIEALTLVVLVLFSIHLAIYDCRHVKTSVSHISACL